MKRLHNLFFNTILLTSAALLMRTVGMSFQVWLSGKIGAAGIGLFQLISSVQFLAITFASSGIRFTVTRLVSEQLGLHSEGNISRCVRMCIFYTLSFSIAASCILWLLADTIGGKWIADTRTILSLHILSIGLPFIGISSVFGGYFTAVQRVIKSSGVQIIEQLFKILAIVVCLSKVPDQNVEYACAAVVAGTLAGDILSTVLISVVYVFDLRRYRHSPRKHSPIMRRMFQLAVPLALSSYARSFLSTLQHLLVPANLRRSGASSEASLASYGTIHGMVYPVLTFPFCFFASLSEMLIPELTESQVSGRDDRSDSLVNRMLKLCLLFSIFVAAVLFSFSESLGIVLYSSSEVGGLIKLLSPLVIIMYMDSVTDGMLKGLGQQLHSMKYNILDALLSIAMIYLLLPRYAVRAYIFILFFSDCFNFTLSIRRLSLVSHIRIQIYDILIPVICGIGGVNFAKLFLRLIGFPLSPSASSIVIHVLLSSVVYLMLLYITRIISRRELKEFRILLQ